MSKEIDDLKALAALAKAADILDAQKIPRKGRWFGCPVCHEAVALERAVEHFEIEHRIPCPWQAL